MITLAQSKVGRADKVEQMVIEMFLKKSEVLELLPFANDVSPNGGSTLTYGYVQEKTPSTAAFRAIGQEYTSNEATVEPKNVKLAVFGGSFEIDRIIKTIEGQLNNMTYQLEQKISAAVGLFHNTMINGDITKEENGFIATAEEFGATNIMSVSAIRQADGKIGFYYLAKIFDDGKSEGLHSIVCRSITTDGVHFENAYRRSDIGQRALQALK